MSKLQKSIEATEERSPESSKYLRSTWTTCVNSRKQLNRATVFMRSAERVDRIFGSTWTSTEKFLDKVYPTDMNVPKDAVHHPCLYQFNPPITCIGKYTTSLNTRALRNRGFEPSYIFCSPTLRTIQTASAIVKNSDVKICIEPGLLEPLEWYQLTGALELPDFYNEELLKDYNIDKNYKPIFSMSELESMFGNKTQEQCIQRTMLVIRNICGSYHDGPAVIVGHAITMDIAAKLGQHGDSFGVETSLDELTSYEDARYDNDPQGQAAKLELGVRYPPGCCLALSRANDSPPYILQSIPNIIPPLTTGTYSNSIV